MCHFLDQRLIPAMQTEGLHEVLLDNASIHRTKDVKKLWEEDSQMRPFIFNPPYNPDSNPVEMVFSIIKRQLMKLRTESKGGDGTSNCRRDPVPGHGREAHAHLHACAQEVRGPKWE